MLNLRVKRIDGAVLLFDDYLSGLRFGNGKLAKFEGRSSFYDWMAFMGKCLATGLVNRVGI